MRLFLTLVFSVLLACPAAGQEVGPQPDGSPRAAAPAARRFEAGFTYGFGAFTETHGDVVWYDGAPSGRRMDLQTTPTLGASFAWLPSGNLTIAVRATRQSTRLLVDNGMTTSRTDVTLMRLQIEVENAFGRGHVRPLLALAAGGVQVSAGDDLLMRMAPNAWHYSVMPAVGLRFAATPRTILRLQLQAPVIWANGELVAQVDVAGGVAVRF